MLMEVVVVQTRLGGGGGTGFLASFLFSKKDGDIFVDPSPYTINLLIAYDEITIFHLPQRVDDAAVHHT